MPSYSTQLVFSFADRVAVPAQVAVFDIDGTTGTSKSLYSATDYTVNWVDKTVELSTPLELGHRLRIDVYEAGNGDQLVKSNTDATPMRFGEVTGFCEIHLPCNYSGTIDEGSGVIVPGTIPRNAMATATYSADNTIQCDSVLAMTVTDPIVFTGTTFGNIVADTTYYIKSISTSTNRITISAIPGIAGTTLVLSSATGVMSITLIQGIAALHTPPVIQHNGINLTPGKLLNVTSINTGTNGITCNNTTSLLVGTPIVFSNTIMGGVIQPLTTYYVESIIDSNEFTISETFSGAVLVLTAASGDAIAITEDYAFDLIENSTAAKIVFSSTYDHMADYVSFAILGETSPVQYGYSLPEVQTITGSTDTVYALTNYMGEDNVTNAVVEINGLRLTDIIDYSINSSLNELTLASAPLITDIISVTSYNRTERQYLNTQYSITGNTVSAIEYVNNEITGPLAVTNVTAVTAPSTIICDSTENFIENQTIIFQIGAADFGGILADGTVYYVDSVIDSTTFTIAATQGGAVINTLTTDTGVMVATVGGTPAVRVQTFTAHGFSDNDIVRINNTLGSVQINNNIYYTKVINANEFDLYSSIYDPAYTAVNSPVTAVSTYLSGGFAWIDGSFALATTAVSETEASTNLVVCASTEKLVVNTPILFNGVGFRIGDVLIGGIIAGQTYYVSAIDSVTKFSISETASGPVMALTNDTVSCNVAQWEQTNVDRLWVTVNGARVPSSSLRINNNNNLSIMVPMVSADKVIITSMVPSATPNSLTYIQHAGHDIGAYRANVQTRTWLTARLANTASTIYLHDVSKITNSLTLVLDAPAPVLGKFTVVLAGSNKRLITQVIVVNVTTSTTLDPSYYSVAIENIEPVLVIQAGVLEGQLLSITVIEGNLLSVNGEQIRFGRVDLSANTVTDLQRGANGTYVPVSSPEYSQVYGVLTKNKLPEALYSKTFSESDYPDGDGDIDGGPLQIFNTAAAVFLQRDIA